MPGVQSFVTPGRHGYSVRFSPFAGNVLACASGQHYGIVGTGSLFVVSLTDEGVRLVRWFEWNDALFDVSWSECNENALVTSAGDGSIHVSVYVGMLYIDTNRHDCREQTHAGEIDYLLYNLSGITCTSIMQNNNAEVC